MEATPEDQQRIMEEWGVWYGKMGPAVVDGGSPFAQAKHITGSGIEDGPLGNTPATGYTLIEADIPRRCGGRLRRPSAPESRRAGAGVHLP